MIDFQRLINLRYSLILMAILCFNASSASAINVTVLANSESEAAVYASLVDKYLVEFPQRNVILHVQADARYKQQFDDWLVSGEIDVLYWQAGQYRLHSLIRQGLLHELSGLWQEAGLHDTIQPSLVPLVSEQSKIYAVPYTYYQWGVFYNRDIFSRLALEVPKTLEDYLSACEVISQNNMVAISLGGKEKWSLLGWFEYLNLRMHGLAFHQKLVAGKISFADDKVRAVLAELDNIFSTCRINDGFKTVSWEVAAGSVARGKAATMLAGNFIQQVAPQDALSKLAFFPFPVIKPEFAGHEIAPMDLWVIAKASQKKAAASHFLAYIAKPENLLFVNQALRYFSPAKGQALNANHTSATAAALLANATGFSQYIDRDTPIPLLNALMQAIPGFIEDRDAARAMAIMESGRHKATP